jgi:hypothetical protein
MPSMPMMITFLPALRDALLQPPRKYEPAAKLAVVASNSRLVILFANKCDFFMLGSMEWLMARFGSGHRHQLFLC